MIGRLEAWLLAASSAVAGGTGIALYVMKHWLTPIDPYAVIHHPWQPAMLKTHLLAVPWLILLLGGVTTRHALDRFRSGRRAGRRTGVLLTAIIGPMILSGVLIQILTSEAWLAALAPLHLAAGLLYLVGLLGHKLATPGRAARSLPSVRQHRVPLRSAASPGLRR